MKKITIILPSLEMGGAEKMAVKLANNWIKKNYKVNFVLLKKKGQLINELNSEINITNLNVKKIRNCFIPLIFFLKKTKPDIIWVGMWPLTSVSLLSWIFSGKIGKFYITEHNPLSISIIKELKFSKFFLKLIIYSTYIFANGIIAVSSGVKKDLSKVGSIKEKSIKMIYNPVIDNLYNRISFLNNKIKLWGSKSIIKIVSVGSLKPQKDYKNLIIAFSYLSKIIKCKLIIIGEGKQKIFLQNLIRNLNLQNKVFLIGYKKNPYPWYLTADLFVLSSIREGLPSVLIEAMHCGLRIVSTDCETGPREILEKYKIGHLVKTSNAIALCNAMKVSLSRLPPKQKMYKRSKDFDLEMISNQYLDYFIKN